MAASLVPDLEPGSTPWLQCMSASKVAAMLGLDPTYDSPYSLWHKMNGTVPPQAATNITRRGHYLEPAIAAWFQDQHPDWHVVAPAGTWQRDDNPWMVSSPDGLITTPGGTQPRGAEFKSARNDWQWGEEHTDQIPVGYAAQCQWQMLVGGYSVTHVAVITTGLDFKEYVVEACADDAEYLMSEAEKFMASLRDGVEPDLDGHDQTYQAIRHMHPLIDGTEVELDAQTAAIYAETAEAFKQAEQAKKFAVSQVAKAMGNAQRAQFGGVTYARRQAKKADGSIPYLVAAPGLNKKAGIAA